MNQQTSNPTSNSASVAPDDVSRRAYELWENEGRPEGCELRHWLQAEQELAQNRSSSALAGSSSSAGVPARNSDVNPLQGTRAGAAVSASANRDSNNGKDKARASGTAAFSGDKNGNGGGQNAAKKRSANAPVM